MTGGSALVGHTGFVGSNLLAQHPFDDTYNSQNIDTIAGRSFEQVVFSAAKAEKWRINQNPADDRAHIDDLKRILASFDTERLVLISTVDVYKTPLAVDESTEVPEPGLHPYGAHRAELERFARDTFDDVLIVRLPALFGPGIKKNVVFDLLNDNGVEKIDHRGTFQFYDLTRLWGDLGRAQAAGLDLVNLATEPVTTRQVAKHAFGLDFTTEPEGSTPGRYAVRTLHADAFGRSGGYLYTADEVLDDLKSFVAGQRVAA